MSPWRFNKKDESFAATLQFDWPMALAAVFLCLFGLLMVLSTTMDMAMKRYDNEWVFVYRQFLFVVFGSILAFSIYHFLPSRFWFDSSQAHLILVIFLLLLVLFSPWGAARNGSHRWLDLGPVTLQVSELAKLAVILYLADYIDRHSRSLRRRWNKLLMPSLFVSCTSFLILLEPDYGTMAIVLALTLSLFFLAGIGLVRFFIVLASVSAMTAFLLTFCSYCTRRLSAYLNPWQDPYDSGHQLIQSLIAVSRGEWFGEGAGNGMQKLFYLSEAHNDFVFSIVVEEFGLLGALVLIVLYAVLIVRCFVIGRRAERRSRKAGAFFCYGVGIWFGLQAYGNMSVAVGLLPTKGLTLPLISYGGSSLVVVFVMIAVVQRLYYELCRDDAVFMHRYTMRKRHA